MDELDIVMVLLPAHTTDTFTSLGHSPPMTCFFMYANLYVRFPPHPQHLPVSMPVGGLALVLTFSMTEPALGAWMEGRKDQVPL